MASTTTCKEKIPKDGYLSLSPKHYREIYHRSGGLTAISTWPKLYLASTTWIRQVSPSVLLIGKRGNPTSSGIKSWTSWGDFLDSSLLFSACPNLIITPDSAAFCPASSPVYPPSGRWPFLRFLPPSTNTNFKWFCFPVLCATPSNTVCATLEVNFPKDNLIMSLLDTLDTPIWNSHHTLLWLLVFLSARPTQQFCTEDGFELSSSLYPQGLHS